MLSLQWTVGHILNHFCGKSPSEAIILELSPDGWIHEEWCSSMLFIKDCRQLYLPLLHPQPVGLYGFRMELMSAFLYFLWPICRETFVNILPVKMQSVFVLIETRCGAKITAVTCLFPTFSKQLLSVCSKTCDTSLRFYLLSFCSPSVCLPDTVRLWCPRSVPREQDRVTTLLPFPWPCSPPLTWVKLPRKPVHFAYQAENYFLVVLGSFAWVYCWFWPVG